MVGTLGLFDVALVVAVDTVVVFLLLIGHVAFVGVVDADIILTQ